MYVLQFARFIGDVFDALSVDSYRLRYEPGSHLHEFFGIFTNPDRYFRSRKTWSTYRP